MSSDIKYCLHYVVIFCVIFSYAILLTCENVAILILHTLILGSGDNIEILPNPTCN